MFEHIMSTERIAVLEELKDHNIADDFYLAGGTAVALHLGHRWSEDLDFFSKKKFDAFKLANKIASIGTFLLTGQEEGTVHGLLRHVKISFLYYPYPLLKPLHQYKNVHVADLTDLALMKLIALVQRGTRKDFIDLYFIDKEVIRLEEIFSLFTNKYPPQIFNPMLLLKSFAYFDDAEKEIMPRMFKPVNWEEIKKHFIKRQQEIGKLYLE